MSQERDVPDAHRAFPTTQWTGILEPARDANPEVSRQALEAFCLEYHRAIQVFLMRRGCTEEEARDLGHDFLYAHVLRDWDLADTLVHRARRDRGSRFRGFLGTALVHFLVDHRRSQKTRKRGEGKVGSIEDLPDSGAALSDPIADDPTREFDRCFAEDLLRRSAASLRHGGPNLDLLTRRKTQAQVAVELDMSEDAVKQMHFQFRQRLAEAIRGEVARTVGPDPADVADEIRYLVSLFSEPA